MGHFIGILIGIGFISLLSAIGKRYDIGQDTRETKTTGQRDENSKQN
jgi:hypothetical protein